MNERADRSKGVRAIGAISSIALIVVVLYIVFVGINLVSGLILLSAVGGLAGPVVLAGEGVWECVAGIFEMFVEGLQTILEVILEVVGSIFG